MAISHKNGIALSAIASVMAVALGSISGFAGEAVAAPPPAGTPTAPTLSQHNANFGNGGTRTTATLSNVQTGDLIFAVATVYNSGTLVAPTLLDSADGTFTDTANRNTYTAHVGTPVDFDSSSGTSYITMQGWTAIAKANVTTLSIGVATGDYRSIIVGRVAAGTFDAAIFDDSGTRPYRGTAAGGDYIDTGNAVTIDNPNTTFSHDLVLTFFGWYNSEAAPVFNGTWPEIRSTGDSDSNRLSLVGKTVSATGNYDPSITLTGASYTAALSFIIKGKNV